MTDYFNLTQQFIEDTQRVTTLKELTMIFHKLINKLGCTHFVCMSHVDAFNPPDDAVVLASYPIEWGRYHSEKQYHKNDPVQQTCRRSITPFTWSNDHWRYMLTRTQETILNEAGEFGLIEGHTIPIHPPTGYPASLSVVFEKNGVDPQALNALHLIAFYLYSSAIQMKTSGNNVYWWKSTITEQKKRILELIAQGKSNSVIGDILNISESTVKDHIKHIYHEFNVSSRPQAVVEALYRDIISFQDVKVTRPTYSNEKSGVVLLQP